MKPRDFGDDSVREHYALVVVLDSLTYYNIKQFQKTATLLDIIP